jgi:hypothetical protein
VASDGNANCQVADTSRQGAAAQSANASAGKKDVVVPQTPIEKLIAGDSAPLREDGGDKYFGFENVSCDYAQDILRSFRC